MRYYNNDHKTKWLEEKNKLGKRCFKRREISKSSPSLLGNPVTMVSYERKAFETKLNPDIRINLDTLVRSSSRSDWDFSPAQNNFILNPLWGIFEVKSFREPPRWLTNIINEAELRKKSISKYSLAMNYHQGLSWTN